MMKTTLTQQAIKSQYITELHKEGIKSINGQALAVCELSDLRRELALRRAVNH
ncbi:hypothetical protein ACWV26_06530 [Rummeliibacillus sp. JY-2-4R]